MPDEVDFKVNFPPAANVPEFTVTLLVIDVVPVEIVTVALDLSIDSLSIVPVPVIVVELLPFSDKVPPPLMVPLLTKFS